MWIAGFYGYSGTPDTPAETFAERVVIREDDCICLQMTSPPSPGADRRVTHRGHEILRYGDVRVFSDHGDDVDLVGSSATATVWPMPGSPPVWGPSISPAPSCMKYSVIALFISDLCIGSGIAQPKGAIARCRRRGQPDRVEHGERADNG